MTLLNCILKDNDCYKTGAAITPKGVMVHSTGANNQWLMRYVQPSNSDPAYAELTGLIGVNRNLNSWNRSGLNACVHAFIGKLKDGTIATVQTLPWWIRGWHSGRGNKGTANDTHISFEICEDGLSDPEYFTAVYKEAVELTAMLCREYGLDPLADGVVICHSEGYKRGIASNHGDVMHWFPKHGKSMDTFRADVAALLVEPEKDEEWEKFNLLMNRWILEQAAQEPSSWSADARAYCEGNGIINGNTDGKKRYKSYCTREELAQMIYNMRSK